MICAHTNGQLTYHCVGLVVIQLEKGHTLILVGSPFMCSSDIAVYVSLAATTLLLTEKV